MLLCPTNSRHGGARILPGQRPTGPTTNTLQVTKHNFQATLPAIQHALDECLFFAFDCEFTGLHVDDARHQFLDTMEERYQQVRMTLCICVYID